MTRISLPFKLIFDESKSSLNGIPFTTWGYKDGGNSEELSILPILIPAIEARPLKDDPPDFTPELNCGIKVVEEVNSFGWNKA